MRFIQTTSELMELARALQGAPQLYLDTEFDSTRHGKDLCLIQVSRGEEPYVIDALRLNDMSSLAPAFTSKETEWVLHAGLQDVELLTQHIGFIAPRIFDTQVAWALLGPEHSVSLAYLLYRVLGIRATKGYQADDWKRRPLPPQQVAYAADDIRHLPALHQELLNKVRALGRETFVYAASRETLFPEVELSSGLSLASFRNAWQLDKHNQAALRFLVDWYNALSAEQRTRAPEPKTLLAIAGRLPQTGAELSRIKGVPRRWAAERGDHFVAQLLRATGEAHQENFVPIEPPHYATFEEIRVEGWLGLARAEICSGLAIAPELGLPARVVRQMRQHILQTGAAENGAKALVGWRAQLVGQAYLAFCERQPMAGKLSQK